MVKQKRQMNHRLLLIYLLVILLILFSLVAYYISKSDENFRESSLIGDAICGNLPNSNAQDTCCAKAHEDDKTIECVGRWQYISGVRKCQYLCSGTLPYCPSDTFICENGTEVYRNSNNDCEFYGCPPTG
ncbi:hypothetical protein COU60_02985 [Candidatus Pacearchaeota archaeon CG10_big_fil_rev_8_21_14_0_10_34_76]|nr:MAG: hypothetical protein COU60_02985 [Candidatus Pacearchaeota archaeon CG10_big_fil_rev_8_21_14_0_10_34_76]